MDLNTLGQRLREAREQRNLSQEDFAALIKRDQRAVSEYENGKRRITVTDLSLFAEILAVPLAYFYEDNVAIDELDTVMLREFQRLSDAKTKQIAIEMIRLLNAALDTHTP